MTVSSWLIGKFHERTDKIGEWVGPARCAQTLATNIGLPAAGFKSRSGQSQPRFLK
jgi:hypothetical protein